VLQHGIDLCCDELFGAVGVVNIARPEMHVEDLSGLGYGAEERIVAAQPFLLFSRIACSCGSPQHLAFSIFDLYG
jgi:hypothetical protein